MRYATRLVGALALLLPLTASAQTDLTAQWTVAAGSESFFQDDNNVRGGAYSAATGNLYVVSRTGEAQVVILDGATGDSTGTLDVTGVAGGFFPVSKAGVDAQGRIYVANLTLNSATNNVRVYRWDSESSAPTVVVDDPLVDAGGRFGDGFSVAGGADGEDARLYIGGSGNSNLARVTIDDDDDSAQVDVLAFGSGQQGRGGAAELSNGNLVLNGSGNSIVLIDPNFDDDNADFETLATLDGAFVAAGNDVIDAMEMDGMLYLAVGPGGSANTAQVFSVIRANLDLSDAEVVSATPAALGVNANTNVAGFADFDPAMNRLFVGASNNFIGSFFLEAPASTAFESSLRPFNSVDAAFSNASGMGTATLAGGVLTVSGSYEMLSSELMPIGDVGPMHIHIAPTGETGPVVIPIDVMPDDETMDGSGDDGISGTFGGAYALADFATAERSVSDIEMALMNGGMYFNIHTMTQPAGEIRGQIYPEGNAGPDGPAIVTETDVTLIDRVTIGTDIDVVFQIAIEKTEDPEDNPVIYGLEFTADDRENLLFSVGDAAFADGRDLYDLLLEAGVRPEEPVTYSVRGFATDGSVGAYGDAVEVTFTLVTPTIGDAVWQIDPDDTSFFREDNNTRGGGYNPTTGHVVVISRSGSLRPVVLDAATGDSVGILSTAGIEGGTFPLSEIAITDDGQIFGANLTVDPAASPVRIYRWADEFAAPTLVYDGSGDDALEGPRYGDGIGAGGTGDDAVVYLSGSGAQDRIAVLELGDDGQLSLADYLVPETGQARARYGIAPVAGEDSAWVNSPTHALAKISTVTGEIGREGDPDVVFPTYGDLAFTTTGDGDEASSYVLTGPQFGVAERFALVDVTADPFILAVTPALGTNANGNATGFTDFDVRNGRLIVAATNNGIAAFPSPVDVMDELGDLPVAGAITSPADGAELTLEGAGNTPFTAEWAAASDDDSDDLDYRWQLSATPDFSGAILVDADVDDATSFTTTFETVDGILEDAGVMTGGSATVYHRVVATDGMNYDASMPSAVTLTRGVITSTPGEVLPTAFAVLGAAPNPVRDRTALRLDLPQTADVSVEVYDVMGRRVLATPAAALGAGAGRSVALVTDALASGTYLYRVTARAGDDVQTATGTLVVAR